MTANYMPVGDFTGWSKVLSKPREVMAWNWLPMMSLDYACEPLFPAVAIGLYDKPGNPIAVRTPPWVPSLLVQPLITVVMREQARNVPIAISLAEHNFEYGDGRDDDYTYAICLHSTDHDQLDRYLDEMTQMMNA